MSLADLFGPEGHITGWQECARAVVVFFYGLVLVRLAGRRVFGKWSALDIVVSIIVGSSLGRALTGGASLGGTLAATTLLLAMHWLLAHAAARSTWFSDLVEGKPIRLAQDGEVRRSALLREAASQHDLDEALRQAGVEHASETRLIVLEPSGKITVLKAGTGHP